MTNPLKLLLALFISTTPFLSHSQTTFEGTITYSIEYIEVPEEVKGYESMLPQEMMMQFKGSKTRIEQQLMGGSQVVVTDSEKEDAHMLMDMMGQKIAVQMSKEELEAERKTMENPKITYADGQKEILGYSCNKAYISQADANQTTTVWFTKEIPIDNHQDFEALDGFPLEYESVKDDMKIKLTATSVQEEEISDYLFSIPSGFDEMTLEELQEMGK